MNKKTERSIADSLDADIEIYPYLPDLLADLWSLGSSLDIIVNMVRSVQLNSKAHVLDLGCGKGATAITISAQLGLQVTGIDANVEFLKTARQKAIEYRVAEKCQFKLEDIFQYIKFPREFDLVIFASLGGLLGDFEKTVGHLRQLVKAGGYIIIDDGYLKGEKPLLKKGYDHYFPYKTCVQQLTAFGDIIVKEESTVEASRCINQQYLDTISKRGFQMIQERPELEALIMTYIKNQKTECDLIENYITGTAWMLKKS